MPTWTNLNLVRNDAQVKVTVLLANSKVETNISKTLKNLNDLHDSIVLNMNAVIVKAFKLDQQMSSPTLRTKWDEIVKDIYFTKGWLNDKGDKSTVVRGQTWGTRVQCKRVHLLTVYDKDAAEHWHLYSTVMIRKHCLAITPFWKRVRELDDKAPKLPCLKDTENCPMDVPATNVSMTGFEMCTLLVLVVSDTIADEYTYLHYSVPTQPKKLVKELTKIENKLKNSTKSASDLRERGQARPSGEA